MRRTATTHDSAPPTPKAPAGSKWVCRGYRPKTGHPVGDDGQLVLVYDWELVSKAKPKAEDAAEPAKPSKPSRGCAQRELF